MTLLAACGFDRPVASDDRVPVIQGTMIAGADSQFFRLDWASSADTGWDGVPHPIDPAEVALVVTGPGGSAPLVAVPGRPAYYVITLPIQTDSTYDLSGTVAGTAVTATTRIPSPISLLAPAGDTVHIAVATECSFVCEVPFQIVRPGAVYVTYAAVDSLGSLAFSELIEGESGTITIFYPPPIARIDFTSFGAEVAAYQAGETPRGNISGAFGLFGGAVRVSKSVRFE